ncbi:hypothetical protein V502_01822 [Pseudogymnoascus sp. VKM F-4520 (FW-2644)]|nr:hypothetical protein V502_01822 [Pseudogymnoascus sp. VKM F-4520 (FW-2644)]
MLKTAIALIAFVGPCLGKTNSAKPQMGWNTWNTFKANINQSLIENTASTLVSTGLARAGYEYVVIDEGWQAYTRDANGRQQANSTTFPSGISGVAKYIHKLGLKVGIYSDAGIYDCGFFPGSYGYEELDAQTYASWEVDYLKYDNCGGFQANTLSPQERFTIMGNSLKNSGRDIFYSLCQWGNQFPWFWADQLSDSYRMSGDITSSFAADKSGVCKTAYCLNNGYAGVSVLTMIRKMRELSGFQAPGSWADMDMLEIGTGTMTEFEEQTHFSFWAALKSPLIIGADITKISKTSLAILLNKDVIAISQDDAGVAASYLPELSVEGSVQIWAGPLSTGKSKYVILALNEGGSGVNITIPLNGISKSENSKNGPRYKARDVWDRKNLGTVESAITLTNVSSHQTKLLVLGVIAVLSLLVENVVGTGGLNGLPVLNGPINPVSNVQGMKKGLGEFVHPGLWHTHDDLERIRLGVTEGKDPWKSAFANFSLDSYSQASYVMQGPKKVICRGSCSNYTTFTNDARAAYQNALMWYITKNQSHWDRSTSILDAWGTNLTDIIGTDTSLLVALEGDIFVNAAEIMRWEGNWVEKGAKPSGGSGFSNQLYWLFARQSIIIGQANYGLASIKALLSFAVYLDDVSMYNYALNAYQNDPCGGLYGNYHPKTGQGSETGRDQGHAVTGLGWAAYAARVIQSQGVDVYSFGDNLLLKAAEYSAKYNLNNSVPYDPKFYRCEAILINGPWAEPSNISRGISATSPNVWDIIYYQYVVKRGLKAPWTTKAKQAKDAVGGEQRPTGSGLSDQPSWGELIWSYPGQGKFNNDDDRTIWGGGVIGPGGKGNINAA